MFTVIEWPGVRGAVLLGRVRHGEWLGEMGVIEGLSRSASARANEEGEAEVLSMQQFLERVSSDSSKRSIASRYWRSAHPSYQTAIPDRPGPGRGRSHAFAMPGSADLRTTFRSICPASTS